MPTSLKLFFIFTATALGLRALALIDALDFHFVGISFLGMNLVGGGAIALYSVIHLPTRVLLLLAMLLRWRAAWGYALGFVS